MMKKKLAVLSIVSIMAMTVIVGAHLNYGGIVGNKPPYNTTIDKNLTEYYHRLTSTGNGTYWFIGGWGWFNESEMRKLPQMSIMYDVSPYDCEVSDCGSGDIVLPVNIISSPVNTPVVKTNTPETNTPNISKISPSLLATPDIYDRILNNPCVCY